MLADRLSKKQTTILARGYDYPAMLFHETGVFNMRWDAEDIEAITADPLCSGNAVWVLIDSDWNGHVEPPTMWTHGFYTVQFTAPGSARYKNWYEKESARIWIMNPWTLSEIVAGYSLQPAWVIRNGLDWDTLGTAWKEFGPMPRTVYHLLDEIERRKREIIRSVIWISDQTHGLQDLLTLFQSPLAPMRTTTTYVFANWDDIFLWTRNESNPLCPHISITSQSALVGLYFAYEFPRERWPTADFPLVWDQNI